MGYTFHGMNFGQFALWFFAYSFFGWAMECVVIRIQLKRWENRGFARLPFCVIYGFGTFIAYNIFATIEHNYVALYFAGCVCATIFEYLTARLMLKLLVRYGGIMNIFLLTIKEFCVSKAHWHGACLHCLYLVFLIVM